MHFGGAVFHQHFGGFAQGARRIADVIDDDAFLARNIADHSHFGHFTGLFAALVDDGKRGIDALGDIAGAGHAAHVG